MAVTKAEKRDGKTGRIGLHERLVEIDKTAAVLYNSRDNDPVIRDALTHLRCLSKTRLTKTCLRAFSMLRQCLLNGAPNDLEVLKTAAAERIFFRIPDNEY